VTYATNILKDNIKNDMFVVMKPRRRLTSWTQLHGGSAIYYASCAFNVLGIERNNTAFTEGSSGTTLNASEWYYDFDLQRLSVRKADGTAPDSNDWIVATIELYLSTSERIWNRIPTDSTSRLVQFFGVIKSAPQVRKNRAQQILGFYPIETTGLSCANDPDLFQDIVWDGSFNDSEIVVYHVAGDLETANVAKIITGKTGNFSFDDIEIQFTIYDGSISLDEEFSPIGGTKYYPAGSGVEPDFFGKPIRSFWGSVTGVRPVNINYSADTPSTSINRIWSLYSGDLSTYPLNFTVTAKTSGSVFDVSVADAQYLEVNDVVWIEDVSDGSDSYGHTITSVNYSTGRIVISPAAAAGDLIVGSVVRKQFARIVIHKNGTETNTLVYGRDFTQGNVSYGTIGFTLTSTCEANLGIATFDPSTDKILVSINGRGLRPTLGGSSFGSLASNKIYFENGVVVLYDIVKTYFGLTESEIDTASFTAALAAVTTTVGFGVPYFGSTTFPTYKELISDLLSGILVAAQFDADGKLSVTPLAKIVTADESIASDDIKAGSWRYEIDYADAGGIKFLPRSREFLYSAAEKQIYSYEEYIGETITQSNVSLYLHKTRSYKTVFSLATASSNKLLSLFADRAGRVRVELNGQFYPNEINDSVAVSRAKMPGFAYDADTDRSRNFRIVEIQKELGKVIVLLDDQKGIDDSGAW
jgi:hypothetical protein